MIAVTEIRSHQLTSDTARRCARVLRLLVIGLLAGFPSAAFAVQPPGNIPVGDDERESRAAERFYQIVRRRPRFGTAFDRMFEWHQSQGSADALLARLVAAANDGDDDGVDAMLAGMLEFRRAKWSAAADHFRKAATLLTDDCGPPWYLGQALLRIGELRAAIMAFDDALARNPAPLEELEIRLDRGRAFVRSGRDRDAAENWETLETLFPDDLRVMQRVAAVLADEGRQSQALTILQSVADKTDDVQLATRLQIDAAGILARLGRAQEAMTELESLLTRLADDSPPWREVRRALDAVLTQTLNARDRAVWYERWLQEHPGDQSARLMLAAALGESGNSKDAEAVLREALRLKPEADEARRALLALLSRQDRVEDAIQQCELLLAQQPQDQDLCELLGRLWLKRTELPVAQRRAQAADVWRSMLEQDPGDAGTMTRVAGLLREVSLLQEAESWYEKAIAAEPDNPVHREALGEFYHAADRPDDALRAWREIASGPRRTADNLITLGHVLLRFGHADEAARTAGDAASLQPDPRIHLQAARLLTMCDRTDEALEQLALATPVSGGESAELQIQEEMSRTLEQGIRTARAQQDFATAIRYQERLLAERPGDELQRRLARLLLDQATAFERDDNTQAACDTQLRALQVSPNLFAEDLESHVQTFEHGRRLPDLAMTILTSGVAPFLRQAELLLQIASQIHHGDPASRLPTDLAAAVVSAAGDDAMRLRDLARRLNLPVSAAPGGNNDGAK